MTHVQCTIHDWYVDQYGEPMLHGNEETELFMKTGEIEVSRPWKLGQGQ